MQKRGQITIFILIGLIIVILIVGIIYTQYIIKKEQLEIELGKEITLQSQIQEIKTFVEECVEEVGKESLYIIGGNGGYYETAPEYMFHLEIVELDITAPYFAYINKNIIPTKQQIEKELANYIDDTLPYCTNFSHFPSFEIRSKKSETKITINSDEILLNTNYPIMIIKENKTSKLLNFKTNIPTKFNIIYDLSNDIAEQYLKEDNVCLSCLYDITLENDLYVNMEDYNDTLIFTITDKNFKPYPLKFKFAVK